MEKSYLLIVLIVTLFLHVVNGANSTGVKPRFHYHVITFQGNINQVREDNILPLAHAGPGGGLSYMWRQTKKNFQDIQLVLGMGRVKTGHESLFATVYADI